MPNFFKSIVAVCCLFLVAACKQGPSDVTPLGDYHVSDVEIVSNNENAVVTDPLETRLRDKLKKRKKTGKPMKLRVYIDGYRPNREWRIAWVNGNEKPKARVELSDMKTGRIEHTYGLEIGPPLQGSQLHSDVSGSGRKSAKAANMYLVDEISNGIVLRLP